MDSIVQILVAIMVGPPIIFTIIGFSVNRKYKIARKVLFIIAAVYLLVGLGICGTILLG